MSDKLTMEESSIIQRYKQRLAEKMNPKDEDKQEDEDMEQIDFGKFMEDK